MKKQRGTKKEVWLAIALGAAFVILAFYAVSQTGTGMASRTGAGPSAEGAGFKDISAQEFSQMLASKDFFLLDVHVPEQEHIEGTDAFVPYDQIEASLARLPADKGAPIVVYCRTGTMSASASQKLAELGYTNLMNLVGGINAYNALLEANQERASKANALLEAVAPRAGVALPVKWGTALAKAREAGAIDLNRYKAVMASYGSSLTQEQENALLEGSDENIFFGYETAFFNLNMLWALGLVNENPILTKGKISEYDDPGRFASTGGWTLGTKPGGELLAAAKIIELTPEQQMTVEEVVQNVYRPCCDNPTSFPDCNHGMAALALAELMASQGATKEHIYDALLAANSYWFTQTYVNAAAYLEQQGKSWKDVSAKEVLGPEYSSYSGSSRVAAELAGQYSVSSSGGACGV